MKNKKKIMIISSVVAGVIVILIMFNLALKTADKIIFDLATKNDTPEKKAEQKAWQEDMPLLGRIFWNSIFIQLDKEEAEREKRIEAGLPIRGKDTALIWRDKYDITVSASGASLDIYIDGDTQMVLDKVKETNIDKKTLYVLSDDGYAVIDNENNCRVFISTPKEELEYSSQHYGSIEDEHIKYLSSYEEFSESEREIFEKLRK